MSFYFVGNVLSGRDRQTKSSPRVGVIEGLGSLTLVTLLLCVELQSPWSSDVVAL